MFKIIFTILFSVLTVSLVSADDFVDIVNKGNKAFSEKKYSEALDYYHSAEPQLPKSAELEYNLAGALNQKADYKEAVESYKKALQTTDLNLEAQAHYNLGSTYYQMGDYQNAITSYQNSLMINPEDLDAKYNLELARKMLKEQMKNKKNNQDQQKQNKDKKEQDKQQKQQQGEQDKQGDQNKQQNQQGDQKKQQDQQKQNKDQKDKDGKDKKEKSEAQKKKEAEQKKQEERKRKEAAGKIMSKEDAERILNGIKDDEAKQQKKLRRSVSNQKEYKGNDW